MFSSRAPTGIGDSPVRSSTAALPVSAHEILESHYWMHLVPDDGLREIQTGRGQDRWIVCDVGEASPDIETATGLQDTSDVAKPGFKQTVELFVRDKVVGQRSVLGSHLFRAVL